MIMMMQFWTVLALLFGFIYSNIEAAQYVWKCASNGKEQKCVPDLGVPAYTNTAESNRGELYIFPLPHLNDDCYGTVVAIKYCYRLAIDGLGDLDAQFNWTVLILDSHETNFIIRETFTITGSHSVVNQSAGQTCEAYKQFICCTKQINGFHLPKENFAFGVTNNIISAQGNNTTLELMAFEDSRYPVNATLVPKADLDLTKGPGSNNITTTYQQSTKVGVRCLWFIIQDNQENTVIPSSDHKTTTSPAHVTSRLEKLTPPLIGVGVAVLVLIYVLINIAVGVYIKKIRKGKENQVRRELVEPSEELSEDDSLLKSQKG